MPALIETYRAHVDGGRSMNAIATQEGVHRSTVMRRVRKVEERRIGDEAPVFGEAAERALELMRVRGTRLAVSEGMKMAIVVRDDVTLARLPTAEASALAILGEIVPAGPEKNGVSLYRLRPSARRNAETPLMRLVRKGYISREQAALAESIRPGDLERLGPTLGDLVRMVVMSRIGVESAERILRMPPRSGKVALRIAFEILGARL